MRRRSPEQESRRGPVSRDPRRIAYQLKSVKSEEVARDSAAPALRLGVPRAAWIAYSTATVATGIATEASNPPNQTGWSGEIASTSAPSNPETEPR